ncbi:MAG: hypothetical protein ACRC6D_08615 [Aeromonas sp.]
MADGNQHLADNLTEKEQQRLAALSKEWQAANKLFNTSLQVSDLSLLLHAFTPLQQLIRQIVANEAPPSHMQLSGVQLSEAPRPLAMGDDQGAQDQQEHAAHADLARQLRDTTAKLEEMAGKHTQLQQENYALQQVQQEWQAAHAELECQLRDTTAKLKEMAGKHTQLQQENLRLTKEHEQVLALLKRAHTDLQRQLDDLTAERDALRQGAQSPVTRILSQDHALAAELGLAGIGADSRSHGSGNGNGNGSGNSSADLVRCVAVLSQLDTIKQLWDLLKERCEQNSRPPSEGELALLEHALAWHNHNWQQKPYQLYIPSRGGRFDFSKEQRAAGTSPSGESLQAVWLPGIGDNSGRLQKKALVTTG